MHKAILEPAHKQPIMDTNYGLVWMVLTARLPLMQVLPTVKAIEKLYDKMKATPRKVIAMIDSTPQNQEQQQALSFLKQYIRSLDSTTLAKFLRHCTGAEVMSVEKLTVEFNAVKRGLARRPIAHTCGPTLELPATYLSYNELRTEFVNILDSGYLQMDIV